MSCLKCGHHINGLHYIYCVESVPEPNENCTSCANLRDLCHSKDARIMELQKHYKKMQDDHLDSLKRWREANIRIAKLEKVVEAARIIDNTPIWSEPAYTTAREGLFDALTALDGDKSARAKLDREKLADIIRPVDYCHAESLADAIIAYMMDRCAVLCGGPLDGKEALETLRARLAKLEKVAEAGRSILYHDERGQGIGYKEAMDAMFSALAALKEG